MVGWYRLAKGGFDDLVPSDTKLFVVFADSLPFCSAHKALATYYSNAGVFVEEWASILVGWRGSLCKHIGCLFAFSHNSMGMNWCECGCTPTVRTQ